MTAGAPPARAAGASGVVHVVPGPERHGVTRHALSLLGQEALAHHALHRIEGPEGPRDAPAARLTHLHLTDHLLAPTATACAEIVVPFAQERPTSLTLHDLPQRADGPGRYERRRAAYAAMAARAVGIVVASEHERRLLSTALDEEGLTAGGPVTVIPLPLAPPAPRPQPHTPLPPELAVFGYVYPGKGHLEALEAAARLGIDVVAVGAVSPGHDDLARDLRGRAATLGCGLRITGYLADDHVLPTLQAAGVPVAPHRHVSASGSIGSWLAAGRRPLVPAGDYVDELDRRCPGSVLRYGRGTDLPDLTAAADAALRSPGLTWLDAGVRVGPDEAACAGLLADVLDDRAREVGA